MPSSSKDRGDDGKNPAFFLGDHLRVEEKELQGCKVESSTFKMTTYNQSLGTKGVTATQHTTTKQLILVLQKMELL